MNLSFSSSDDNSTLCYVAGAVARSLLKQLPKSHNECCSSMVSRGTSFKLAEDENFGASSDLQAEEFLMIVSRGGLQHPSDCVFVTCCHALQLYEKLKEHDDLQFLLMNSSNPRELFVTVFEKVIVSDHVSTLLDTKCNKGHSFRPMVSKITRGLFNLMAKNITAYENDKIHSAKKRNYAISSGKKTPDCRKIRKLSSNS